MGAFDPRAAAELYAAERLPEWLREARSRARAAWLGAAMPTRKTEAWKYTALNALDGAAWQGAAAAGAVDTASARIAGLDADYLVFVDGQFCAAASDCGRAEDVLVRFAAAGGEARALIERHLGRITDGAQNPFVDLGGCWATDGALVHVGRGSRAGRALCIVHLASGAPQPRAWAQRTLVVLDEGAEAELIELFDGVPGAAAPVLVAGGTEILLGRGARLAHRRLHLESGEALHLGGIGVELARDAHYRGFVFAPGSRLKRLDLRVLHREPGSEALLDGVYLARGREHVDLHTTVEHAGTHGTTHQVYRGLIDDEARAVFNGRILIRPGAQKTSADLANRNLLFSDRAEVDTKPELEIYADDVKCSHGTTVSRVEERGLYYLQSRGIARREAEVLLATGFVNELLEALGNEALASLMRARLRAWFGNAAEDAA